MVLLHDLVRRTLGHRAALVAALMLALSPASVVMDRYNNPDALLALLLVASAWALVRALESGRLRHVILCGVFVGLAFNTKMLEGYLVLPALAVTFLLAGRGRLRERFGHLLTGGLAMGLVSIAWYGTMMLIPASGRPYVGDSTNNSWFQLIFGANGFSRVTGGGRGGPAAYSIATVGHGQTGSNPTAGPAAAGSGGFARFAAAGGISGLLADRGARGNSANAALVKYLRTNRDGAKYLVAANGSQTAAPIALATGDPVITMGGFMGADPAPTVAQLKSLIESGQLRYVLLGGGFGGGVFGGGW